MKERAAILADGSLSNFPPLTSQVMKCVLGN